MIIEYTIQSIGELIDFFFLNLTDENYEKRMDYTFRGQKNANYQLISSLKRNPRDDVALTEVRSLNNFRKYTGLYEESIHSSVWRRMIIAQHHGLPTRCLDFSFSPLVALHFALCDNEKDQDAAVWAINHKALHGLLPEKYKKALVEEGNVISFTLEILEKMQITINNYDEDMGNRSLIFLEPPSIDERIINQFSHLAIIPRELDPLDNFLKNLPFEKAVYKFIIPRKKIPVFRSQLDSMNITERVLFPGLDGTSSYLKRRYHC